MSTMTQETRHLWAFAVDTTTRQRRGRRQGSTPQRYLQRYAITACSPAAKQYGVHTGMSYSEARKLAPGLRVIVCNR